MSPSKRQTVESRDITADIQRLEIEIRQLKIEYDRYFIGVRKREPSQLTWSIKKLIKSYAEVPFRKYSDRFRYNALVSRYNVMAEQWAKRVRIMEEGERRRPGKKPGANRVVASCRFENAPNSTALRDLYTHFLAAHKSLEGEQRAPSYEKFVRGISAQAKKLRKDSECGEIELRVILDDRKVQLRARVKQ